MITAQMLLPESRRKKLITVKDVEAVVAKIARIPPKSVSRSDKDSLQNLERDLKTVVFGQDKAIAALASSIKLARAGLREPDKPIGSYLFSGPTGVGKTEVARQLALTMGIELQRFDMSEYMERHSVSRLIGAPPGYVGFDQGGLLTDAVDQNPHLVLLLDEIEKAHPDVFNILLQIMDHGRLTDHNGKSVDFRNVILIMTTNAGAADMAHAFAADDDDLDLDGEPVGVPAGLAFTELTSHCPVARIEVFDSTCEAVPWMRHAIGCWWSFKKNESFGAPTVVE